MLLKPERSLQNTHNIHIQLVERERSVQNYQQQQQYRLKQWQ